MIIKLHKPFGALNVLLHRIFLLNRIEKLSEELWDIKFTKEDYIEKQKYEKAAMARMKERELLTKIGWARIWKSSLVILLTAVVALILNIYLLHIGRNVNI